MNMPVPPPPGDSFSNDIINPPAYGGGSGPRDAAASRVKGPAISLMVIAGLTFVMEILSILGNLMGISMMGSPDLSQLEGVEGMEWLVPLLSGGLVLVFGVIVLAVAALIFFGAMKMKALESYGLAMTAAILSIIPCFSICCLGIPFGIWALVVLLNDEVKNAFA